MSELNGSSRIQDGSAEGLLQFLDYVVNKGYGPPSAVTPWKSAARQVLQTVEGSDDYGDVDVRSLDLEDYLDRFETLARSNIKVESVQAYRRRFTNAVEAYLAFITGGKVPTFRQGGRRPRAEPQAKASKADAPQAAPAAPTPAPRQSGEPMIDYPFPVRPGVVASLRLPARWERADAERLATFARALVYEQQLELPERSSGGQEDAE
jgi:hypothetical protein